MIQRIPFSYDGIDADIRRLGRLLEETFGRAGIHLNGRIAVLNLACGRADETGILSAALSPAVVAFYLGVDLRADAIREAEQRWISMEGEVCFLEGNAAMLGRMKSLPEFDFILMRHQNYWHEPMVWEGILDEALAVLKPDGYLVCTSYFDLEHELFLASMRTRGASILINLRNFNSRALPDAAGKSVDRWIAAWRKT
jgi:SAM-dependent methyltransferase